MFFCGINKILKAGNILTHSFYGGNLGPLREEKKMPKRDHRGREVMFIGNSPILDKAFFLHLFLTLKSILLIVFCLSTFLDLLLVSSDFSCDESKNCFILDKDYSDTPITNCSMLLKSPNITVVCYKFVFDYRKAAGYAGGLYTVSRLSLTILANVFIFI